MKIHPILTSLICLTLTTQAFATVSVSTEGGLNTAIIDSNGTSITPNVPPVINFTDNITIASLQLRPVNTLNNFTAANVAGYIINGNGFFLSGGTTSPGLFFRSGTVGSPVTVNSLVFQDTLAKGGNGGTGGGGGGAGLGGAVYVFNGAHVILNSPTFTRCAAQGGNGGPVNPSTNSGGGGGGGIFGNGGGGGGANALGGSGGGGFGGTGYTTTSGDNPLGGGGGGAGGAAPGGTPGGPEFAGLSGTSGGTGGALFTTGGNAVTDGGGGGGGGGGTGGGAPGDGGNGLFGGGGGGTGGFGGMLMDLTGGSGDIAGGGGGVGGPGSGLSNSTGGSGGFGGGGGGVRMGNGSNNGGIGGFGGGNGSSTTGAGGAGAGFGGAIFIEEGGNLTLGGSPVFGTGANANTATGSVIGANPGSGLGQDIFMMSGADLTFDNTNTLALQTAIEGNQASGSSTLGFAIGGSVTKSNTGTVILNGATNTYTGPTNITDGELQINGSATTDVTVNGGTFSGDATLLDLVTANLFSPAPLFLILSSGDLTLNTGRVAPGVGGVGAITLDGSYTQNGGTLEIDITPTGNVNDVLMIASSATLNGGALEIVANAGNYIDGTTYTVISSPVTGDFTTQNVVGPAAPFITVTRSVTSSLVLTVNTTLLFEFQNITSPNAQKVVECIVEGALDPNSDFARVVEVLGTLTDSQVNEALEDISPESYGALEWINARNRSQVADILAQHRRRLCCDPRDGECIDSNLWVSVFGQLADNHRRYDFLRPFDTHNVGALIGYDYSCNPCVTTGAALGYNLSDFCWDDDNGSGHGHSYYGALYGSWAMSLLTIDGAAIGGATDNDVKRHIVFGIIDRTAKSDFWTYFFTGNLGLYGDIGYCNFSFEPFVLADYHYYHRESFKEGGAESLNLDVRSKDQHMMRTEAGLNLYYEYIGCNGCFAPYIGVSWIGDFPLHKSRQDATFRGQDCLMDVESYDSLFNFGSPVAGFKWTRCNGLSFIGNYKGIFNSRTRIHELEARFEWIF